MIFGKTYSERNSVEQERLRKLHNVWLLWFAWRPVLCDDGRVAWLEYVERKRVIHWQVNYQLNPDGEVTLEDGGWYKFRLTSPYQSENCAERDGA